MEHNKNLLIFLDLEFNQPSRRIIDIGAVVADMDAGQIIGQFSSLVNPHENLSPDIEELTGISDSMLVEAPGFCTAWAQFMAFLETHGLKKSIFGNNTKKCIMTWGNEDTKVIRTHLEMFKIQPQLPFAAVCDFKSAYSFILLSRNKNPKGGLKAASRRLGLATNFGAHRALADAHQTCLIALRYYAALKASNLRGIG